MGAFGRSRVFWLFVLLLLVSACVPSGCGLDKAGCDSYASLTGSDPAHCYQWIAVQNSDTDECDKVQSENWAGTGQNPPQDKCYLMIAEKDVDPAPCANIAGGLNSYTPDECYQGVGAKGGSAEQCAGLSPSAEAECRSGVVRGAVSEGVSPDCGKGFSWQAGGLGGGSCVKSAASATATEPATTTGPVKTATTTATTSPSTKTPETVPEKEPATPTKAAAPPVKPAAPATTTQASAATAGTPDKTTTDTSLPAPPDSRPWWEKAIDALGGGTKAVDATAQAAQDAATSATDKVKATFGFADAHPDPTPDQEKSTRLSTTLDGVEDEGERSAIIKEFIGEREKRDAMTADQQKQLLADIRARRDLDKQLDIAADTLKKNTWDKATGAVDKKIEEAQDAAKEGVMGWMKGKVSGWWGANAPPSAKDKLDRAQQAYDAASKKAEQFGEHLETARGYAEKAKETYDAVKQVTDQVNNINDKVAQGAIDPGRARVLKGGVLLGTALEQATKKIPVFGDTASEVTKGTFGVVNRVAIKRAERGTKLDSCIEDPENCDPNGISAY